jgi:hypothetical protein
MSNITEPIGNTDGGGAKPLTTPIMVDGIAFKFQRDADEYIRTKNAMTPAQIKKEADDIALAKATKNKEVIVSMIKNTAMVSAVPLGLAYFSYYQKYSLTKGIAVVVIGSGIAYSMAIAYAFRNGM